MSNFVCSGAKIYCSYGSCTSSLVVLPDRTVDLSVGPMANKVDHIPQKNIFSLLPHILFNIQLYQKQKIISMFYKLIM